MLTPSHWAFGRVFSDADSRAQFDPLYSPLGWHWGHIAWQQECWLLRRIGNAEPIDRAFDTLFDSFKSEKVVRGQRLPQRALLDSYVATVRERVLGLVDELTHRGELEHHEPLFRFLANHERQHAETMTVARWLGRLDFPLDRFADRSIPPPAIV